MKLSSSETVASMLDDSENSRPNNDGVRLPRPGGTCRGDAPIPTGGDAVGLRYAEGARGEPWGSWVGSMGTRGLTSEEAFLHCRKRGLNPGGDWLIVEPRRLSIIEAFKSFNPDGLEFVGKWRRGERAGPALSGDATDPRGDARGLGRVSW